MQSMMCCWQVLDVLAHPGPGFHISVDQQQLLAISSQRIRYSSDSTVKRVETRPSTSIDIIGYFKVRRTLLDLLWAIPKQIPIFLLQFCLFPAVLPLSLEKASNPAAEQHIDDPYRMSCIV